MIYTLAGIESFTPMYRGKIYVLCFGLPFLWAVFAVFGAGPGELLPALPGGGKLTHEERRALRLEMIEYDVSLRSIPSLIALEDKKRVAHYFESYAVFETSENPVYKGHFESALKKLKSAGLYRHLETIQKEGQRAAAYIREKMIEGKATSYGPVYQSYKLIVENCRRCHEKVFSANEAK